MSGLFPKGRFVLAGLALALAASVAVARLPRGVETSLYALASGTVAGPLREIAAGTAGFGRILLEEPASVASAVSKPVPDLKSAVLAQLGVKAPGDWHASLKALSPYTAGLLSEGARCALVAGAFTNVMQAAVARLYGPMPPLFSVKDDPFALATDWALALQRNCAPGWTLQGGYPSCTREDCRYTLLALDLREVPAARLVACVEWAREWNASHGESRIWCSGTPFHSALTAESAKVEINILSALSIACVFALGWLLFRSGRFAGELVCVLGGACLLATAALVAAFPRPHVLTFVFGTSLIGLAVDYVYHARAAGSARAVWRPLTASFLTTEACFAPLLLADVVVLRQMALFSMAGLAAAWGGVFLWPGAAQTQAEGLSRPLSSSYPLMRLVAVGVVAIGVAGLFRVRVSTAPQDFYRPAAYLASSEKKLAAVSPGTTARFAYVEGRTLEEALEREERAGVEGLSRLVPSRRRQEENRALKAKLAERMGTLYTAQTGIPVKDAARGLLDPEALPPGPLAEAARMMRVPGGTVSPCPSNRTPSGEGVRILEPRAALVEMMTAFTRSTFRILLISVAVLLVLLAAVFRREAWRVLMPVACAVVCCAGIQAWMGIPLTFFSFLGFFVTIGLGLDYAIFTLHAPSAVTRRTVFYSFLTSLTGLGLLAFTRFEVTHAMGVTFALGLSGAYFFAVAGRGRDDAPKSDETWYGQREQSAGNLRLAILWGIYVVCGKTVLKLACVPVMAFIYPFAKPARMALARFAAVVKAYRPDTCVPGAFRHLLGFAWSLVDKTDVCTRQKAMPRVTVRDDAGGRAFLDCVAAHRGGFLLASHLGTIDVLPALAAGRVNAPHVHAFQQLSHDAVFTRFFLRHAKTAVFTLHDVASIGVETAVAMQAATRRGEFVLMAGDRVSAGSAKTCEHDFLGMTCRWPRGVFTFARLLESPVFFVTLVRTGWNAYEAHFCHFDRACETGIGRAACEAAMLDRYVRFLEDETLTYPGQWHQFYDFFAR